MTKKVCVMFIIYRYNVKQDSDIKKVKNFTDNMQDICIMAYQKQGLSNLDFS